MSSVSAYLISRNIFNYELQLVVEWHCVRSYIFSLKATFNLSITLLGVKNGTLTESIFYRFTPESSARRFSRNSGTELTTWTTNTRKSYFSTRCSSAAINFFRVHPTNFSTVSVFWRKFNQSVKSTQTIFYVFCKCHICPNNDQNWILKTEILISTSWSFLSIHK